MIEDNAQAQGARYKGRRTGSLGDAAAWPIQGLIRHFRPVIEERIAQYKAGRAPSPLPLAAE